MTTEGLGRVYTCVVGPCFPKARSLSPSANAQPLLSGWGNMRNSFLGLTPWPLPTAWAESGRHWLFLLSELSNTSGAINGSNPGRPREPGSLFLSRH